MVKIVDFGLAKLDAGQRLTQDGTVVGTAEYISPEQVTGRDTDARSDQYALGCILYEMLTSQLPFDGPTTTDVVYKHVYKQPIPPRKVRPLAQIPEALEQVIARCMAKKPADRFEKMTDLETALTAIEQVLIGSSQAAVVLPPPASRLPRGLVWSWLWWRGALVSTAARAGLAGAAGAAVAGGPDASAGAAERWHQGRARSRQRRGSTATSGAPYLAAGSGKSGQSQPRRGWIALTVEY